MNYLKSYKDTSNDKYVCWKTHRIQTQILAIDNIQINNKQVIRLVLHFSNNLREVALKDKWLKTTKKLKELNLKKEKSHEISFILNNIITNRNLTDQQEYLNNFVNLLNDKNVDINDINNYNLEFDVMYAFKDRSKFYFISGNNMDIIKIPDNQLRIG